ncbi:uncharacterized protein LOC143045198 isoform X3 [Mytilus galloprovincialis]|uniref:uncharacterized protein LOC143045198 isoform X3 n=1 Tax=Mytilus galloprovincialis TaxID=29158 RepID=UPI003F7B73AF
MDLFPRFVGILMLFVLYIAVGVKGVTFDAACNGTGVGNCSDSNTICDAKSHKCACSTTSYKTNATTCVKKIALNGSCSNTPTDQCADSNAVCDATKHTCGCKSTHFVNTTGACQLRVAFDAGCKGTGVGDCTDSNNICDTNSHKCACSTTSYKKNATTCATKVAFNATCVVAEPAKDQCVANTECKNAGVTGTYQCLCKATHYESAGSCEPRKSPKVNCASGECVSHASCDSGTNKCVCDAGYDPSPTISPTMCNGVVKVFTLSYMYVVPILVSLNFLLR